MLGFYLIVVMSLGCTDSDSEKVVPSQATENSVYVCPNGIEVFDSSLCPSNIVVTPALDSKINEEQDSDNDGIPDSIDPLPNIYGTVSADEYQKLALETLPELTNVIDELTKLMNGYNGRKMSKEEFINGLDEQDEILYAIIDKMDVIPPKEYEDFNDYYFPAMAGYENSIYYLKEFADSNSQMDLNLAQSSAANGRKNLEKAQSLL